MQFEIDFDLSALNTFGVQARAENFVAASTEEALITAIKEAEHPIRILGGGSNVLLVHNIPGTLIHINIKGKEIIESEEDDALIRIGAGELWHEFVLWTLDQELYGFENLSLIPGRVGAAPIQNIGAYGVEQKDHFAGLEAIELSCGKPYVFGPEDCHFGYRDSYFKNEGKGKYAITAVYYRLSKNPNLKLGYGAIQSEINARGIHDPTPKDVSDVVIAIRQSKLPDPGSIGNGGSFFKNPIVSTGKINSLKVEFPNIPIYSIADNDIQMKTSAAWLIDQCGWKGKKIGNTGTYENHALVLVNHGDASGAEIWDIAQKIQLSVMEKFGIELEPEVNIW